METIVLVIHMLIGIALVGVVLLQRSEGGLGGLGGGGGGGGGASGGMGGLLGNRETANLLTRTTGVLAGAFMVTSVSLAILANDGGSAGGAIVDEAPPAHGDRMTPLPAEPAQPTTPSVPTSE